MWTHYRLQPKLAGEPDPVILSVYTTEDTGERIAMLLYIVGARTLGPKPALSPSGIRQMSVFLRERTYASNAGQL